MKFISVVIGYCVSNVIDIMEGRKVAIDKNISVTSGTLPFFRQKDQYEHL